jgi:two-component system response regulator ChvI
VCRSRRQAHAAWARHGSGGYFLAQRELQALDRGAVDFVDKARGTEVLAHRLRVIIEAGRQLPGVVEPRMERRGALTLHQSTARALWRQRDIGLTITEYKILVALVSHSGQPQTYRAIYDTAHYAGFVAGSGENGHNNNVRALIKRIRRKFLAVDPEFSNIENMPGVGYRWRDVP